MSTTQPFHRDEERDDLLALATDVLQSQASSRPALSARDAARALVGVAGWVARKVGVDGMQTRMALLARHAPAWRADVRLNDLPREINGRVDEHLALIAVVASGLWHLFGASALRSAIAFWATERDASVWQQVAA